MAKNILYNNDLITPSILINEGEIWHIFPKSISNVHEIYINYLFVKSHNFHSFHYKFLLFFQQNIIE